VTTFYDRVCLAAVMAPWLLQPWGAYTGATRLEVLLFLILFGAGQGVSYFIFSDGFTAQQAPELTTPMFQSALGMLVANIVATCFIFVSGGGCSAILGFARANMGPTLFLATVTVLSVGFYHWAIHLMSTTTTMIIMFVTPMLLPILAACFERRPADGKIVMYGLWPCCMSGTPQNPHCGVYPGIMAIVVACVLTVSRFGLLTTTLGVLCAVLSMLSSAASYTTAAVLLGRDKPERATPVVLAWWVSLLSMPALLIISLCFVEGERVVTYVQQQPSQAALIYTTSAVAGCVALLMRYAAIHTASALTVALCDAATMSIADYVVRETISFVDPANLFGIALLPFAGLLHAWYMMEREAHQARLAGGGPLADQAGGAGVGVEDGKAPAPSEYTSLVKDESRQAKAGGPGGCAVS